LGFFESAEAWLGDNGNADQTDRADLYGFTTLDSAQTHFIRSIHVPIYLKIPIILFDKVSTITPGMP